MNEVTMQEWIIGGGFWLVFGLVIYWATINRKFKNVNLLEVALSLWVYINSQNPEEVNA
jgi:hypothetical protein